MIEVTTAWEFLCTVEEIEYNNSYKSLEMNLMSRTKVSPAADFSCRSGALDYCRAAARIPAVF